MFIPIRTDHRLTHVPMVNLSLIGLNVLVYIITRSAGDEAVAPYLLDPVRPAVWQFVTYQFLHANAWHLLGNLLFLYLFGNGVEDRLGRLGYVAFYLAGGVAAGLGHCLSTDLRVLGASGSVSAVTGLFLVLLPRTRVTFVYWYFIIGELEVSSMFVILFQIAQNLFFQLIDMGGSVAYVAHLSGYGWGIATGFALLGLGLIERSPYDLWAWIDHRRRRHKFRRMASKGYQPWESPQVPVGVPNEQVREPSKTDPRVTQLRSRIAEAIRGHDIDEAATQYSELLAIDPEQVLSHKPQLEVSNHLMSRGDHEQAARGYEMFLRTYRSGADVEQVELILGVIYARYLGRGQRARELLTAALRKLDDPAQKSMARDLLAKLDAS